MYNSKTKQELINEIYDKLKAINVVDTDAFFDAMFSTNKSANSGLMFVPMENLQKIAECPIDNCKNFREVYQAWGKYGALKFTPYEVDDDDNPSLVLRHNRFLHMFRGYSFQASGTVNGITDCGSGSYRTNFLTQSKYYNRILSNGLISYMLWWAALIDVGFRFDNFVEEFNKDVAPIEKFLSDSIEYWRGPKGYSWADVEKYITIETGSINIKERKMYQLDDEGLIAYLAIGKKSVQVETADNVLITIKVPKLNLGTDYNLYDEDDKFDFEVEVEMLENNHYLEMLAVMALKLAGIHISFTNFYPLKGRMKTMRPINAPFVISVKSLNDIYGCTPDEF